MITMAISCMGGFCGRRESCALYHARDRSRPAERLCEPRKTDAFEPIKVVRPAGTWERSAPQVMLSRATWLDSMVPA